GTVLGPSRSKMVRRGALSSKSPSWISYETLKNLISQTALIAGTKDAKALYELVCQMLDMAF
ncbi:unnamed protein product, partial [marine sediment metagenome]